VSTPRFDPRDIGRALQELPQFQAALKAATADVNDEEFEGTAADGGVSALVSGLGSLREIRIGVMAKRELDNQTLGLAVVEAVRKAEAAARNGMTQRFAGVSLLGVSAADFLPSDIADVDDDAQARHLSAIRKQDDR
jgi:nucleoid-associated protein EbfC